MSLNRQLARVAKHTGAETDGRRGKVFSVRITDDERAQLVRLEADAREHMPWRFDRRRGSLGAFIIWAALQLAPPAPKKAKPRRA